MTKILIVDDDLDFLETTEIILKNHNFEVLTTSEPAQIYQAIVTFIPNVILLDIHLNGEDGRNICKGLKNHFKTKHVPIILCSGDIEAKNDYPRNLVDDFIEKPFEYESLIIRLNEYPKKSPFVTKVA